MIMTKDLSEVHHLISNMFRWPTSKEEWKQFELSEEQIDFFKKNGFVSGIKMLDDAQIEIIRNELTEIASPQHPGHELFYEFHSNESTDPEKVLFHALGAWRITSGLHDVLWNPRFLVAASQLLGNVPVRFCGIIPAGSSQSVE